MTSPEPWQRPAFQPGHTLSTTHGATSERKLVPLAAEVEKAWRASPSWPEYLRSGEWDDLVSVASWSKAVCLRLRWWLSEQDVEAWLSDRHEETEETEQVSESKSRRRTSGQRVVSGLEMSRKWESAHAGHLRDLGLTPTARARLGLDVVQAEALREGALDRLAETGRRALDARADALSAAQAPDLSGPAPEPGEAS